MPYAPTAVASDRNRQSSLRGSDCDGGRSTGGRRRLACSGYARAGSKNSDSRPLYGGSHRSETVQRFVGCAFGAKLVEPRMGSRFLMADAARHGGHSPTFRAVLRTATSADAPPSQRARPVAHRMSTCPWPVGRSLSLFFGESDPPYNYTRKPDRSDSSWETSA